MRFNFRFGPTSDCEPCERATRKGRLAAESGNGEAMTHEPKTLLYAAHPRRTLFSEMSIVTQSAAAAEVEAASSLDQQFAAADRAYRESEDALALAWARIQQATEEHRRVTSAWAAAMARRNVLLNARAAVEEKIRKQEAEQ